MALCVSVAIDDIIVKIDKLYDYLVPDHLLMSVDRGVRVVVPFSKSNMRKKALILDVFEKEDVGNLKTVIGVADIQPVLNDIQIDLLKLLKSRYFITYFKAFKAIVPRGIDFRINERYFAEKSLKDADFKLYEVVSRKRKGIRIDEVPSDLLKSFKDFLHSGLIKRDVSVSCNHGRTEKILSLNVDKIDLERHISELDRRFERQRDLLSLFLDYDSISFHEAVYYAGCSSSTVDSLVKKGFITVEEREIIKDPYKDLPRNTDNEKIILSEDQQSVYTNIVSTFGEYKTHLIHGVTGSGKTLVYMSLIDTVVSMGKSVIFMVPEISLTPQMLSRFYSRYGDSVAVVHSGLSTKERAEEWKKIKSLDVCVVVGTRSAVFSPVNNLGLVIIDEEHESSYKSESAPRYHARDISRYICNRLSIPLVLGSATPSVESFFFSQKNKYQYHSLLKRFNNNPLPSVEIINMVEAHKEGDQSFLSEQLKEAMHSTLSKNEQIILFLNRRGANPIIGCRSCGYVAKCPNCEISLTYHLANNRCMCHYCDYSIKAFSECPECSGKHIKKLGIGTQLVYNEIEKMFPDASVLRMDLDTVSSYLSYGEKLSSFKNGDYDIMLGTQMVAKGLDFPNVTLVGVINADLSLHVEDFRAGERTFSLLTQVCGRSGRAGKTGRAIVQTYSPDNQVICLAKDQDYFGYFDYEINFRKAFNYPPFCDIVRFTVTAQSESLCYSDTMYLYKMLNDISKTEFNDIPIRLLYPTAPRIAHFNEKYRYNLIIKSKLSKRLYELLDTVHLYFTDNMKSELSINVNPMSNV